MYIVFGFCVRTTILKTAQREARRAYGGKKQFLESKMQGAYHHHHHYRPDIQMSVKWIGCCILERNNATWSKRKETPEFCKSFAAEDPFKNNNRTNNLFE